MFLNCPTCGKSRAVTESDHGVEECRRCRLARWWWGGPALVAIIGIILVWQLIPHRTGDALVAGLGLMIAAQGAKGILTGRMRKKWGEATGMEARARGIFAILVGLAIMYMAWNHPERVR